MLQSISSLSFTLSSKEETNALISQCQSLLQQLYETIIDSSTTLKLTSLSSTFETLKENVSKQRNQLLQFHLKSLQHLQILLFQKDYSLALQKIDEYKKYPLIERFNFSEELPSPSYQPTTSSFIQELQDPKYQFEEAIKIVEDDEATFEEKERAWLSVVMNDQEQDEQLMHITTDDIERAQIEIFKKEFNIHGSSSESLLKNFPETPEKKVGKSSVSLKKKKKSKSILSSNKYTEKERLKDAKITSSQKRIAQKKTIRKKPQKDSQESKTAKKQHQLQPFHF